MVRPTQPATPRRAALHAALKAHLWQMLALVLGESDPRPMTIRAGSKAVVVTATIGAPRTNGTTVAPYPGLFLSALEAAVWLALDGQTLAAKSIARKVSQPYTPKLRTILANLVSRGVLTHEDGKGYRRATGVAR